ncbi:MAG: hypothetical protein J6U52_03470 [Alistipes sp.]|nr:hypothetical protein [Alistipes sp.]
MIKRIIGGLFAVAVIVVIAFTAIGAGSYKSMLPEDLFQCEAEPVVEVVEPVAEESAEVVEMQDSVEMDNATEVADDAAEAEPAEPAEPAEQE